MSIIDPDATLELECPNCGEAIELPIAQLRRGAVTCPECGLAFEGQKFVADVDEAVGDAVADFQKAIDKFNRGKGR